jgi:hypothetical protein
MRSGNRVPLCPACPLFDPRRGGANRSGTFLVPTPKVGEVARAAQQKLVLDHFLRWPCALSIAPFSCANPDCCATASSRNARTALRSVASDRPAPRGRDAEGAHVDEVDVSARQALILPVMKNQMLRPTTPTARRCRASSHSGSPAETTSISGENDLLCYGWRLPTVVAVSPTLRERIRRSGRPVARAPGGYSVMCYDQDGTCLTRCRYRW